MKKWMSKMISGALAFCMAGVMYNPTVSKAADSLDAQIEAAEQELSDAEANLDALQAQYDLGMIGFVDWMLARGDLSDSRIYDLNKAKTIYQKASEESLLDWAYGDKNTLPAFRNNKVVVTGDEKDAISIKSTRKAIQYMYELNEYRRTDTNFVGDLRCVDAYVDFQNLAYAQAEANRVAGISTAGYIGHLSVNTTVECLAFGSTSPIVAWGREKSEFNGFKSQLGIETLTSLEQLKAIEDAAKEASTTIGHYTGMFYTNQRMMMLMGMGYCEYGSYGVTHCYGASGLYASTPNGYYTVAEFEAYFDEYCATLDIDAAKKRLEAAKKRLEELLKQRYENCSGHTYKFVSHTDVSCTVDGGDLYVCTKCGKQDFRMGEQAPGHNLLNGVCQVCSITAPTALNYIYISYGGVKTSISPVLVEEGNDAALSLTYKTATPTAHSDEFKVEVDNTDVLEYIPGTCDSGIIRTKKPGIATITVTSVVNPSLSKTMKIDVTDVGGHDYSLTPIVPGSGSTTQVCSKCGRTNILTAPTRVKYVYWQVEGVSGSSTTPKTYTVGDKIIVSPYFDPSSTNLSAFDVISSDPTRVRVERPSNYPQRAYLYVDKPGDVTITIVNKYDASVKVEYTLDCMEVGGHTYGPETADEVNSLLTKTCTGCGHAQSSNIPSTISGFKVQQTFYANGKYYSRGVMLPEFVNQDYGTSIQVVFEPDYLSCVYDFDFKSSDSSVCKIEKTDERTANLSFLKPGEVTITATSKYTPSVKYEQKLYVSEPNGHTWEALPSKDCLVQAATCTAAAQYYKVCSGCGFVSRDLIYSSGTALGHDLECDFIWNSTSDVDYKITCKRDNETIASGKVSKFAVISHENATCIAFEKTIYEATVAYKEQSFKSQNTEIGSDYADHSWDLGTIVEESNCLQQGTKRYECRVCHITKDETLPFGRHKFVEGACVVCAAPCTQDECEHHFVEAPCEDALVKAASCTACAKYYKVCEYCELISDEIYDYGEALGHAFEDGVCVTCGESDIVEGWYETEEGRIYRLSDGTILSNDWYKLDAKWYYFNAEGIAQTGWQRLDGKWYYFSDLGEMQNGWQKIDGKWYYFAGGVMATGWKQISGKWYYFDGGTMVTGWKKISNVWYYFDGGVMVTGWKKISNVWYYFDDGAMATGWKQISNKWYYFDGGAMVTGWKQISGKWYYFEDGAMATSKWINDTYYVKANGVMATNEWVGKYYVDANGKYVKGKTR